MTLEWLKVERLRNISDITLDLTPGISLIYGDNGSGKTSLLESIYLLSSGRSFRGSSTLPMVQRGEDNCLVVGRTSTHRIGVRRNRTGDRDIRLNGETVNRATDLARVLPTLLLGPETVDLLLGPPALRRRFLNWGVFHVEHGFASLWEEANRSLRQRNQALRSGLASVKELETWSHRLAGYSEKLDSARRSYVEIYQPLFAETVAELLGMDAVGLEYYRGWEADENLFEIYMKDIENDQKRGHTQSGFHRADVRITVDGQSAVKVCSRGELKALVWSMVLSQGALASSRDQLDTLYLVDDLASEFDPEHRRRVCRFLAGTSNQVFLTGVEKDTLLSSCDGVYSGLFHVKHGNVEVR